jgi:amino-acid N-acetyltransferase
MLERLAGADGAERLHLLTTDAAPFFEHLGYEKLDRAEAPAAIAATEQFRTLCSGSATYLTRKVRTAW